MIPRTPVVQPRNHRASPIQPGGIAGLQEGGAMPIGPNQGIVPASTEGQVLTMDAGGVVPGGYQPGYEQTVQQAQTLTPQVSGRAAGFVSGLSSGQVIGNDMVNAWHDHQAREYQQQQAGREADLESDVTGVPQDQPAAQTSPLDAAKNSVEGFFKHLWQGVHGKDSTVANPQDVQGPPHPTAQTDPHTGVTTGADPTAPAPGVPASPGGAPAAGAAPPAQAGTPAPAGTATPPASPAQPAQAAPVAGAQPSPIPSGPADAAAPVAQKLTQEAVQGAQQQAQSGQTPAPPAHSLTPDWWEHSEKLKMQAMRDAWKAGEDPARVGAAMDALRTGAVQGQILRNYSAANAAFLAGDDAGLKKALENVNYYLPNGQGLTFKTATAQDVAANEALQGKPGFDPNMHLGALMYRTPFAGMAGHENDPPFTTITQQHISMLAQNAMDPKTVQDAMIKSYTAQRETEAKLMSAHGAELTGAGRNKLGDAAIAGKQIEADMMPVNRALKEAQGANLLAGAEEKKSIANKNDLGLSQGPKISTSDLMRAKQQAAAAVDQSVQGPMIHNMSTDPSDPNAGKTYRDSTKVATLWANRDQNAVRQIKDMAGQIFGANMLHSTAQAAADAAAFVLDQQAHPTSHKDPKSGKMTKDAFVDSNNVLHIYQDGITKSFYLSPNVASAEGSPVSSSGGSEDSVNPADNEPAAESPESTASGDAFNE